MNGIPLTRLSGLDPNMEYRLYGSSPLNGGLDVIPLGNEFDGMGCTCQKTLSGCSETSKANTLYSDFEKRVKIHLINTYNYIVANRGNCGIMNPDQLATAYKRIIENWNDPRARESAMSEAERIIGSDDKLSQITAQKIAYENNLRNTDLVKVLSGTLPKMKGRRRVTIQGLGSADIEILPDGSQVNGTSIGFLGLDGFFEDYAVSLGGVMVEADPTELLGDDGTAWVYVLSGINTLGRKVAIKIKPKNPVTKLKQAVKSVKNELHNAGAGIKKEVKKASAKTAKTIKKAVSNIKKYNPVSIAARNGFLLAIKLNIKNLAAKLKWGYASEGQALKAGFTKADYKISVNNLKTVETFWQRFGGDVNALRNAVLKSKAGHLSGLGDPTLVAALAAATPIIIAVLKMVSDSKVKKEGGAVESDPNGDGGEPLPNENNTITPPSNNNPAPTNTPANNTNNTGADIDRSGEHSPYVNTQIDQTSEPKYQNLPDSQSADPEAQGNKVYYSEAENDTQIPNYNNVLKNTSGDDSQNAGNTNNAPDKKENGTNTGLLVLGVVGVVAAAFLISANKGNKSINGLEGEIENIEI